MSKAFPLRSAAGDAKFKFFVIDRNPLFSPDDTSDNWVIAADDYKFVEHQGNLYWVCELICDDDDQIDTIKVWVVNPLISI